MSENQPQQQAPQQIVAQLKCQECTKDIQFPMPSPRVVNFPDSSLIVFTHERLLKCPECGTPHMFAIAGLNQQLQIMVQFVKIELPSSIVEGTSQNMQKAVSMNSLVSKVKQ